MRQKLIPGTKESSNVKRIVKTILFALLFGVLANVVISFFLDFDSLVESLARVRFQHILIPFLCYFINYLIDALRLLIVLSQYSYKIPFRQAFLNSVVGVFFSNITPMATGGQPFQIYHLKKNNCDSKTATNIMLSRIAEYMLVSIGISIISIGRILAVNRRLGPSANFIYLGLAVSIFFTILIVVLFMRPELIGRISFGIEKGFLGRLIVKVTKKPDWPKLVDKWAFQLKDNISFLWGERLHVMIIDILLSIVSLAIQIVSLYSVIYLLTGIAVNFIELATLFIVLNLVVYYIPTPGGSGSVEGIYAMVYSALTGVPVLTTVAIIVWRFSTYYLHILFGFVLIAMNSDIRSSDGE